MNRTAPTQSRAQGSIPAGYRPGQPPVPGASQAGSNTMYYGTAGAQSTTSGAGTRGAGLSIGGGGANNAGFPPIGGAVGAGAPPNSRRGGGEGPPGFATRSDQGDFPALGSLGGSHNPHLPNSSSTYAASAQPAGGQGSSMMYLNTTIGGLAPPPPPGMGPTSSSSQANGMLENLRDDFPALGAGADAKDSRIASYLRAQANHQAPASPPQLTNGATASQSATPSTNHPLPSGGAAGTSNSDGWTRASPTRPSDPPAPLVRPVQQILSSPVDKWGLKALLYEIKTQMGKGDRGALLFGEELSELGVDVTSDEPLYGSFVTPWAEPSAAQPARIHEHFHIPSCYQFPAPPLQSKLTNFSDETLFLAFYASPGDAIQLEAASELYTRGWRYETQIQCWFFGDHFHSIQLPLPTESAGQPVWIGGPMVAFDTQHFMKRDMPADYVVNAALLEATRPAALVIAEDQGRKESSKSPASAVIETPSTYVGRSG